MNLLPRVTSRSAGWRRRGSAVLISCLIHGSALTVLACLARSDASHAPAFAISSAWEPVIPDDADLSVVSLEPTVPLMLDPNAGGSGSPDLLVSDVFEPVDAGEMFANIRLRTALSTAGTIPAKGASRRRAGSGRSDSGGHGTGSGSGVGPGSAPGFFGLKPPAASRVVFVVDNSRSMNHPHESELKTRFRRVKFELLKSLAELQPSQSFYVVFFNNETVPMPGASLQSAHPAVRDPFLRWVGDASTGGGPTDPRTALRLAVQLQPDVICFLTDGEFPSIVNRQLKSLRQDRIQIHTFAIGDTLGEEVLKALAENNRGEYRFVP